LINIVDLYTRLEPSPMHETKTQQRILEAAGQVFAEKGFEAATVRDILDRAKVRNLAAINYHFGDKENLYVEVVKRTAQAQFQQHPLPAMAADTPPADKLRAFIAAFVNRVVVDHEPAWHGRLMMRELFQPTAACIEFVREYVRPTFETLLGILAEFLPAAVPEVKRHQVAFSIVGQCLHYRLARPVIKLLVGADEFRTYDARVIGDHIAQFSLAALGLGPPLVGRPETP
jgi:AcrR family transcriptional regulator